MANVTLNSTVSRLRALRDVSEGLWDMAAETAETERKETSNAKDSCLSEWEDAIGYASVDQLDKAIDSLKGAARVSSEWGDDGPEQDAIKEIRARQLCAEYESTHGALQGDTLRVIVDAALALDPAATVADIHDAVVEATEEHAANVAQG